MGRTLVRRSEWRIPPRWSSPMAAQSGASEKRRWVRNVIGSTVSAGWKMDSCRPESGTLVVLAHDRTTRQRGRWVARERQGALVSRSTLDFYHADRRMLVAETSFWR